MATETAQNQQPAMPDLEQVYDDEIQPLVRQLVLACQERGMSILVGVQFADPGIARTFSLALHADERLKMATMVLDSRVSAALIPVRTVLAGEGEAVN